VGTLKGVGRVYQQAYVDTYSKMVHAKLYTTKTPIIAADLLNDRVLPFHEGHDLLVLRILPSLTHTSMCCRAMDRSTEYCGRVDKHDFQLFLAINNIDHTKTKVKSPQTNGGVVTLYIAEFWQNLLSLNNGSCLLLRQKRFGRRLCLVAAL